MLLAVALTALGGLGIARLVYPPLPDPAEATPEELLVWAATVDLSKAPDRIRSALAIRLEREYRDSFDPVAIRDSVAPEYYDRVMANLPVLLRTWLFDRAAAYQAADPTEKQRLIEDTLAAVDAWGTVDIWTGAEPDGTKSPQTAFLGQIETWQKESSADRRTQLDTFLCDFQAARLMRTLFGGRQ